MKDFYQKYINEKHSFDKITMLGIFSLIIVIAGMICFTGGIVAYMSNAVTNLVDNANKGNNKMPQC